jgi:putative flippase GtrA
MTPRWIRFLAIGLLGFVIQLAALGSLIARARWPWLAATLASVELAVVHNFLWHARWTWRDRPGASLAAFMRFQLANGMVSLTGNAALMTLFTGVLGVPPLPANVLAVAVMSVGNFMLADRWVFRAAPLAAACVLLVPASAAAQSTAALGAWERYVAATELRLDRARMASVPRDSAPEAIAASGESVHVPSGTISDWRGSVFIRGATLDQLLQRLQHPGTPPPQDDIVSSRVIARGEDSLRVSIRLVRRAIVTVAYDTEHEMRFQRWSPRLATARSVATRIEEIGGSDHGFLWRLHSYWRYEQTNGGVWVDLESLTLSRDVPSLVRPIAAPLVTRIARESMLRTLEALLRFFNTKDTQDTKERIPLVLFQPREALTASRAAG